MKSIIEADGGVEYIVPDLPKSEELLSDGPYLKNAVEICKRNQTKGNIIRLLRILSKSVICVPCNAIMSDRDREALDRKVQAAMDENGGEDLVGETFATEDEVRMVPDILQNGDDYFFPVFTSGEEMGEYGEAFSKVSMSFIEAVGLAENNDSNVAGIVINAFSEPYVINREAFELIKKMG